MRRSLLPSILFFLVAVASPAAFADDASVELEASTTTGLASLVGPRVGLSGPPSGLAVQLQGWHEWTPGWSLTAALGLSVGGEASFESDDEAIADARYGSTVTPSLSAGARYQLDFDTSPFALFVRAGLLASFVSSGELVGMMIGPEMAFSLSYPLLDELDLVAETGLVLGYGNYKVEGSSFAATLDVAVGAQLRF